MAEFRISSDDGLDLRRLAAAMVESQGWPREQVSIWESRRGSGTVVVTVDDTVLNTPEPDPLSLPVHTRSGVHQACEHLRRGDTSLRGVDFADLRDEAARFFSAGWSVADLMHALSHRHDGTAWPRGEGYQGIEWLEHRLRSWKTPSGDIRPSISQETAQMRIVGRTGLPADIGLPDDAPQHGPAASPQSARTAADDARRLIRVQTRTTSDGLEHLEHSRDRRSR